MIFIYTFTFHGFKKNRPNDQLPDGLLAQLVMTSAIPVQRSRVRIPYKPDSTLSSVYVTTESHEKRMRVAGQCALRFAGKIHVVSYFCFKILGNLKHRRFISTFYTWKGR